MCASYPTARALRKLTFSRLIRARTSAHATPATSPLSRAANVASLQKSTSINRSIRARRESAPFHASFFPPRRFATFAIIVIMITQCKTIYEFTNLFRRIYFNEWNINAISPTLAHSLNAGTIFIRLINVDAGVYRILKRRENEKRKCIMRNSNVDYIN